MIRSAFLVTAVILMAVGSSAPQAQPFSRTWVSGKGVDQASCGGIANPCRTLQHAHDNTSAGGEIDVLDSAGYGSVVITKGIYINGDASIAGIQSPAGASAITIHAGANDAIVLRNLSIEGANIGLNGIVFRSGASLTVDHCSVQNFSASGSDGNGILLSPLSGNSKFTIINSVVSNNRYVGIHYFPGSGGASASGYIGNTVSTSNGYGFAFNTSGTSCCGTASFVVADSTAPLNTTGVFAYGGGADVILTLDGVRVTGSNTGIDIEQNTQFSIGRSWVSDNYTGITINHSQNANYNARTWDDNHIANNFYGDTPTFEFHRKLQ